MYEPRHVAINVDKLWDLIRDAYEEGRESTTIDGQGKPYAESLSRKQVIEWLEWYWQAKNEIGT